ncbi:ATP-dependent DNA helicase [Crocinitomix catalasitica]|uniref:ATP-dependent DNA helicase n=1 Tax=Crocinitomix catalasitica TaxID=184607 RepID=UPI00055B9C6E|nr:AAA family ATPase [Crocinitomix catalasitica]
MKNQPLKSSFRQDFITNLGFAPTSDQVIAIEKITDFIWNKNELDLFVLKGYAGTGKTSLIASLVKTLPMIRLKTVLLAPTGRAAKVISNYSRTIAHTIHRKIYFKDDSFGDDSFALGQNKHTNTLFIIDEASMISTDAGMERSSKFTPRNLLDDLIEYVYSGVNCKIVFVGDTGQLPPIGMQESPALSPDYLLATYGLTIHEQMLNEIVRQAEESGILNIAGQLRDFEEEPPLLKFNKDDARIVSGVELQDELESAINKYGQDEVIVVTRSNKRANSFNEQIRRRILWQEDDLNAGDVLMATRNNYHWLDAKSEAGFIANGELMEILRIQNRENIFGAEFADVVVRLIDYPDMKDVELKINIDSIRNEGPSLSREQLSTLFYRIAAEEYPLERNQRSRNRKVMQNPYFQAIQVKFGYAVTCHKAQGGQWSAVFVDQGYFVQDMWDVTYMRWLYTAITRSSEQLYLVNFTPDFIGEQDIY